MKVKLVYICSPLRGDIETNIQRANRYCRFAAKQETVPLAPHTIFTQFLDDDIRDEREAGIYLGMQLLQRCEELWVFGNRITEGMAKEIEAALNQRKPILYYNDRCELITDANYNLIQEGDF